MADILGKEWHPFITFIDLINSLPDYIDNVMKREEDGMLYLTSQAKFELNQIYTMEYFESHEDLLHLFPCNEVIDPDQKENNVEEPKETKDSIVLMSDNAFLQFEALPPTEGSEEQSKNWKLVLQGMISSVD